MQQQQPSSTSSIIDIVSIVNWSSSLWDVPTRVHNETGFWGPVDAIHQFCEPHYQTSPYLCEFYNTLSSFVFLALAIYVWKYNPQVACHDIYVRIALVWLALISVGSILFHATMRYSFQLLDEFPMVGFMATLLCGKITSWKRHAGLGQAVVIISCIWLLYVYVIQAAYEIFIHGFTLLCLTDVIIGVSKPFHVRYKHIQVHALTVGLITILSGRLAWEMENRLCHVTTHVWPLHSVWHVLGCWSAWTTLVFTYVSRLPTTATIHGDWLPGLWLSKPVRSNTFSKRD